MRHGKRHGSPTSAGNKARTCGAAALIAISVLSRLPQLRSPNMLVDGDESVLGLMAKHVAQRREFPIFFYGQHYAFEPVETVPAALSFLAFGVTPLALKSAMLALWTVGVLFLYLALAKRLGTARGVLISAVLVVHPAWAAWSMKAGGGYLTAFVASSALAWLLAQDAERDGVVRWSGAAVLTAVIFLAQPLWLPGVLPLAAAVLWSRRRLSWAAAYGAVAAAGILAVKLTTRTTSEAWGGPAFGNSDFNLSRVARQIYVHLTGSYYLGWAVDPPGTMTIVVAAIWCVILCATVLIQVYRVAAKRFDALSHVLFVSVWGTLLAEWALLWVRDARYLLPLSALLVTLAGVEVADLVDRRLLGKRTALAVTAIVLVLGSLSMVEFRRFNWLWQNPPERWSESKRLQQVIGYLKVKDVGHVFSMNGMLDWQLTFYSNEGVLSRGTDPLGRYPAYVKAVDRALANGEPVALVGYTNASGAPGCWDVPICTGGIDTKVANPESIFIVDGKYFVYVGVTADLLRSIGFRFWD